MIGSVFKYITGIVKLRGATDNTQIGNINDALKVVESGGDTSPTIFNFTTVLANTEYSQALPSDTKNFLLKARTTAKLKIAYQVGDTSTNYITVDPGATYSDLNFYSSATLYFQSSKAGEVVEIIAYT